MGIPYYYSYRNLWTRRLTTLLTAGGMALVVFVFAATLMLVEGLRKTLIDTGSYDNVIVIRKGAGSEVQSGIDRDAASVVASQPEVAIGDRGREQLSRELVVLVNLPKKATGKPSNVVIRGTGRASAWLRPQVSLVAGRMPTPGLAEIAVGKSIFERFNGTGLGEELKFGGRSWRVVGIFEAGATGFNSEIWGDADQLMQAFRRPVYSSILFRLRRSAEFDQFRERIESDPRLTVEAKRETKYYADQSEAMARFLRILGLTLTVIFSVGAIIGAMITMYAAVANRTVEIGTLRALGFNKVSILSAFVLESLFLGLVGGGIGVLFASFMQLVTISTMNWQTFSELAFTFDLTPGIALKSVLFSLFMGLLGGLLPAIRGARMSIIDALRAS